MTSKEALEVIRHCCEECLYLPQNQSIEQVQLVGMCLSFIDDSLNRLEKFKKAVEIIKNKKVDIKLFIGIITALKENKKALEYYNCVNNEQLTQQEFDLLKEVFKNE